MKPELKGFDQRFTPDIGVDTTIDYLDQSTISLNDHKNLIAIDPGKSRVRDGFLQLFDTIPREIIAWNWGIFHINVPADLLPGDISYAPGTPHIVAGDNEARVYLFQVAPANDFEEQLQLWIGATDSDGNVLVQPFKLYQGVPDLFYYAPVFVSGEAHTTIMSAAPHCKIKFEHDALGNPYFLVVTGNKQTSRPLKIDFEKFDDPFGRFTTHLGHYYHPGFLFSDAVQNNDYKSGVGGFTSFTFQDYHRFYGTLEAANLLTGSRQTTPSFALRVQAETLEKEEIVKPNGMTDAIKILWWKNYGYADTQLPGWYINRLTGENIPVTLQTAINDPLDAAGQRFTPTTPEHTATVSLLEGEYDVGLFDTIVSGEHVPVPVAKTVIQVGHEKNVLPIDSDHNINRMIGGLTTSITLAIIVNPLSLPKNIKSLRWATKFKPADPKVTGWTEWQELSGSPIDLVSQAFSQKGYTPKGNDTDPNADPQYDFDNADFYIGRNIVWKGYGKIVQAPYAEQTIGTDHFFNYPAECALELIPAAYKTADGVHKLADGLFRYMQIFLKANTGFYRADGTVEYPTYTVNPINPDKRWEILQARGYESNVGFVGDANFRAYQPNGLRIVNNAERWGNFYYLPDGVSARLCLPLVSNLAKGLFLDHVESPGNTDPKLDYLGNNIFELEIGFGWVPFNPLGAGGNDSLCYYNLFEFYDTVGQVNPGKVFEDRSGESIVERYEDRLQVGDEIVTGNIGHINEATNQYELKPALVKTYGVDTITNFPRRHYPSKTTNPVSLEDDVVALGGFTMESEAQVAFAPQLVIFCRDQVLLYQYSNKALFFQSSIGGGGIANKFAMANDGYRLFYLDRLLQTWQIDRSTANHRNLISKPIRKNLDPYKAIPACVSTARIGVCEINGEPFLFEFVSQQWTISSSGGGGKGVALSSFLVPTAGAQPNTIGWLLKLSAEEKRGGWSPILYEDNSLVGDVVTVTLSNSGSGYISGVNKTFKIDGGNGDATFKANVSAVDGHISTAPVLLTAGTGYSTGTYNIISLTPGDPGINGAVNVVIGTDRTANLAKEYLWLPYIGPQRALMAVSHGKLFSMVRGQMVDDTVTPIQFAAESLNINLGDSTVRKRFRDGQFDANVNVTAMKLRLTNEQSGYREWDFSTVSGELSSRRAELHCGLSGVKFVWKIYGSQNPTGDPTELRQLKMTFLQSGNK